MLKEEKEEEEKRMGAFGSWMTITIQKMTSNKVIISF